MSAGDFCKTLYKQNKDVPEIMKEIFDSENKNPEIMKEIFDNEDNQDIKVN